MVKMKSPLQMAQPEDPSTAIAGLLELSRHGPEEKVGCVQDPSERSSRSSPSPSPPPLQAHLNPPTASTLPLTSPTTPRDGDEERDGVDHEQVTVLSGSSAHGDVSKEGESERNADFFKHEERSAAFPKTIHSNSPPRQPCSDAHAMHNSRESSKTGEPIATATGGSFRGETEAVRYHCNGTVDRFYMQSRGSDPPQSSSPMSGQNGRSSIIEAATRADRASDSYKPCATLTVREHSSFRATSRTPERSSNERLWYEMYQRLVDYCKRHGRGSVPPPTTPLGVWAATQRLDRRHGTLPSDREQALADIGFEWAPHWSGVTWGQRYAELVQFYNENGHCRVRYSGGGLGGWVSTQRRAKKAGRLSEERTAKLEAIGFIWDARPDGDASRAGVARCPFPSESARPSGQVQTISSASPGSIPSPPNSRTHLQPIGSHSSGLVQSPRESVSQTLDRKRCFSQMEQGSNRGVGCGGGFGEQFYDAPTRKRSRSETNTARMQTSVESPTSRLGCQSEFRRNKHEDEYDDSTTPRDISLLNNPARRSFSSAQIPPGTPLGERGRCKQELPSQTNVFENIGSDGADPRVQSASEPDPSFEENPRQLNTSSRAQTSRVQSRLKMLAQEFIDEARQADHPGALSESEQVESRRQLHEWARHTFARMSARAFSEALFQATGSVP